MYLPAISATEQAFQPFPSGKDRFNLVHPLHSFSEGNPFLVGISPCSGSVSYTHLTLPTIYSV